MVQPVDNSGFLTVRSLACRILLQNDYKRSSNVICDHCSQIKRNCSVTSVSCNATSLRKRESYMSSDELLDKLRSEQACRKKAERNKYLMAKIESEIKDFDTDDHQDILTIFQRVDEDMHIFWEAQRKALSRKNLKGHRWHPK